MTKQIFDVNKLIDDFRANSTQERAIFQRRLCKTRYEIIGCTNPYLRALAKSMIKDGSYKYVLEHDEDIYEYVFLQGLITSYLNDIELAKKYVFKIDDWSLCDTCHLFKRFPAHLDAIFEWVKSDKEYVTRFAIISYMCVYLKKFNDETDDLFIEEIYKINHHEYYVDMAIAWFIQKLYSIDVDKASKMLENKNINEFTKKKAIQKIKDSQRERGLRG